MPDDAPKKAKVRSHGIHIEYKKVILKLLDDDYELTAKKVLIKIIKDNKKAKHPLPSHLKPKLKQVFICLLKIINLLID